MPEYVATMRVVHLETWSVEATTETEARKKISELTKDVYTDETGGEVTDWEVCTIVRARS